MEDLFDFRPKKLLYAVFGNPISHSKSPLVHSLFAKQFGINLDYRAIQVDVGGFEQAVSGFQASGGKGLNVTIPFKSNAFKFVDQVSERAKLAAVVNTIVLGEVVKGDNTDGMGLVTDIEVNCGVQLQGQNILVVGAGGAARGIMGPILERSPRAITVANRTKDNALDLVRTFSQFGCVKGCGLDEIEERSFDIVINSTSTELAGSVPSISPSVFQDSQLVYDLMYSANQTLFTKWADSNGAQRTSDGLGMLVEQAAGSFFIWHGEKPETKSVIDLIRKKL